MIQVEARKEVAMNHYSINDLSIGHKEVFTVEVTSEMFDKFREITGDINPLHNDEDFAKNLGHKGRVAFGMLTASFLSTLAGVYLPGERSLIHSVETKFTKPVYIGDVLSISGEVTEINDTVNQIVLKVEIKNQNGEKVLRGKMKVGFLDERK